MAPAGRNDQRRLAIERRLALRRGGPGTGAAAEVDLGVWREVAGILAPMIGAGGVEAIFKRSLQLTTPRFPWLGFAGEPEAGVAILASCLARLKLRDPKEAAEANLALLVSFTDLLVAMIGASLTDRLLGQIWALPISASPEETSS
jgi:hypothetical protein